MQEKLKIHNRHSIRIKEYDYSTEGMYFITICTQNRKCILSKITTYIGEVKPTPTLNYQV